MKIFIQLSTEAGFQSQFIRVFTWSDFSHVDFILPQVGFLGSRVNPDGAKAGGVQIRPLDYAKFTKTLQLWIDLDTTTHSRVMDYAMSQIGKPYDKTGILNFGLHRNWKEDDSWFCSEFVAACFERGGWPLLDRLVPVSRITPRDIELSPYWTPCPGY